MAQAGKSSIKRSKPSYGYAIIGIALVLFLFGIVGWFFLNLRKTGDYFKENIQVHAYLNREAPKKKIDSLIQFVKAQSYLKSGDTVEYVTKEKAIARWNAENDTTWKQFLKNNPLPESIDFYVKAAFVNEDSLNVLSNDMQTRFPGIISEVKFPTQTVTKVSSYVKTAGLIFLVVTIILTILVIFSIDNTIRLAMYSNRFLIKTMQMVGATRWFITKPILQRAFINGIIASILAILAIRGSISLIEAFIPSFKILHDAQGLYMMFFIILLLGMFISVTSTYRSVLKYLKLKLDDLY
jgi:cell division transport system permease protein